MRRLILLTSVLFVSGGLMAQSPLYPHNTIPEITTPQAPMSSPTGSDTSDTTLPAAPTPTDTAAQIQKDAANQKEFQNLYHEVSFPLISTGIAQNFTIVNGTFTKISGGTAVISLLTASSGTVQAFMVVGEPDNADAPSGRIGEYVASTTAIGSALTATTNVYGDITSITLTPGRWLIDAVIDLDGAVTGTSYDMGIGTASGNSGAGLVFGDSAIETVTSPTAASDHTEVISGVKKSINSSTPYYLKLRAQFSAGTLKAFGRLSAVRI